MLQRVSLTDFKSFRDETAPISPFTLLVGANATGKSNFVDALRFLHGMAQGWPLSDVASGRTEGSTKVWSGIRGGSRDLVRKGADRCRIESEWRIGGDGYRHSISTDGKRVHEESIPGLFSATRSPDPKHPGKDLAIDWYLRSMTEPDREHVVGDVSVVRNPPPEMQMFRDTLAWMHFFEPVPNLMREYMEKPAPAQPLRLSAKNIPGMLWTMCQDPAHKKEVADWLVEFCAPEIADIDFEVTPSDQILLRVTERDGTQITARSMSDGTLRFLALLAALRSLHPGTTLVIEDLEHGLHPSRLHLLVDAIHSVTGARSPFDPAYEPPVVVATTHSPMLLEAALSVPEASVLLFARSPEVEGSVIRDVRSLPNFEEVHERRDFAYLLETGWLERAI